MHAGATSGAAGPSSPRHTVLPPPPGGPDDAAERTVDLTEPGLVDVMLLDHRHEILLFNRFTVAAAQGNTHVMELLVGALAVDIRLHSQACLDVLCPLLERRYGARGAELAAAVRQQLQGVERDVLEMLTFRRERDWAALAHRTDLAHKEYGGHVYEVEVGILPRLAADMRQDELVSSGLLFQQCKQTASLVPHTGSEAFAAATALGPDAATVLGGPLVAGIYQPHSHAHMHGSGTRHEQQPAVAAPASKLDAPQQHMLMGEEL